MLVAEQKVSYTYVAYTMEALRLIDLSTSLTSGILSVAVRGNLIENDT